MLADFLNPHVLESALEEIGCSHAHYHLEKENHKELGSYKLAEIFKQLHVPICTCAYTHNIILYVLGITCICTAIYRYRVHSAQQLECILQVSYHVMSSGSAYKWLPAFLSEFHLAG